MLGLGRLRPMPGIQCRPGRISEGDQRQGTGRASDFLPIRGAACGPQIAIATDDDVDWDSVSVR